MSNSTIPLQLWPLDKIKPYDKNPRAHPQAQIDLLAKLMIKYGVDQPIVVDESGVILKGHGRRLAAMAANFKKFPVLVRKGLSEDDKRGLRIADNQIALLSDWDEDLLKSGVDELRQRGFDMSLLGFDEKWLVSFMASTPELDASAQLAGLKFAVIVECETESDQAVMLAKFTEMGMKCRALVT